MAFPDGKYISLATLKAWGTDITAAAPTDNAMGYAIARAESAWEKLCGCAFDQQTQTLVAPFLAFVDGNGWLHLDAAERGPVTAVSAVSVLDISIGATTWQSLTWDAVNGILLPPATSPPRPNAWTALILPATPKYAPRATGQLYVKWSYTAGFAVIPNDLQGIIARLAWWEWKAGREAPMGKIVMPQAGMLQIPLNIPPDIRDEAVLWQRPGS